MSDQQQSPRLSLPCRSVWEAPQQPAPPADMLAALEAELQQLGQWGAAMVEFPADLCVADQRYARRSLWGDVAARLEAAGLGATLHLPFLWVDLAALDRHVWEGSVTSVSRALEAMSPLEPEVAVVHPTNFATQAVVTGPDGDFRSPLLLQAVERLVTALERLGAGSGRGVLALENLEGIPWPLFVQLVEQADVDVCLDVGHLVSNGDDPVAAVADISGRLSAVHLHDARPPAADSDESIGTAHLTLGEGDLHVGGLKAVLADAGFAGPVILEVEEGIEPSAAHWRDA